jgi:hypothetical protein
LSQLRTTGNKLFSFFITEKRLELDEDHDKSWGVSTMSTTDMDMKPVSKAGGILLTTLVLAVSCLTPGVSAATGFSNLEGRQLAPAVDTDSMVGGLLGTVLTGGDIRGRVRSVTVVEDSERRLVVSIEYTGFAGTTMFGEVCDEDHRGQREISRTKVSLESDPGQVKLSFDLKSLAEGATLESSYLKLSISDKGNPALGLQKFFQLPKRWQAEIEPENVVVKVPMVPVGKAASLRSDQPSIRAINLPRMRTMTLALPPAKPTPTPAPSTLKMKPMVLMRAKPKATPTPSKLMITGYQMRSAQPAARSTTTKSTATRQTTQQLSPQAVTTMKQTSPATAALSNKAVLMDIRHFKFGVQKKDEDLGARGPSGNRINLLEAVRSDVELPYDEILSLKGDIYQDQNPASGVLYYLPRAYNLDWDEDDGYELRMLYAAATESGEAGDVLMAMRLSSGISTTETGLASELLRAYQARHPAVKFSTLSPLPLDAAPQVSLSGGVASQFDIPPDKIVVNAISDVLGEMDVSWITDPVTKENLQLALTEDVGINGVLTFTPASESLDPVAITVQVRIAEASTFGRLHWRRSPEWSNRTPYPVRLNYMHALMIHSNEPIIYSWDLGAGKGCLAG